MSYLKRTSTGLNDLQWSTDLETRISSLESRLTSLEGSVIGHIPLHLVILIILLILEYIL